MKHRGKCRAFCSNCAILLCFCAMNISAETNSSPVIEPNDYRTEHYRAPVPTTLLGASVINAPDELHAFIERKTPRLIDVYPAPNKPEGLVKNTLWIEPTRDTLPNTYWLANVGHGIVPDDLVALLKAHLPIDDTPIVIFCEPSCWHSWNASKRALELGATHVYWYRAGVKGWKDAGYPLEAAEPVRP